MRHQKLQSHPLITGTIVLTAAGFITRIIGFFYRIYLSRLFGEEGMGIYQLLSPVLALSFSLTAAGYQTAISKFVAEKAVAEHSSAFRPLFVGLSISLPLSLLCTGAILSFSDFIGEVLLREARTIPMLRVLALSIPLAAVHACINGYFYGCKKTGVPAASQLLEQLARVGCVYICSIYAFANGRKLTITVAVFGLLVGELLSMVFNILAILPHLRACRCRVPDSSGSFTARRLREHRFPAQPAGSFRPAASFLPVYGSILSMALPLTANRIILNLLQSVEAVSIPAQLKLYGYDTATALSVYGVLTGMAMPLIFFPNAITGSVAVLLLPLISESYAADDLQAVKKATLRTVRYCLLLGGICMAVFCLGGHLMGTLLFDSPLAGHFITTLGFICPFMYLDTTLSSILQGLGMAGRIFLMNVICLLVRLGFVFAAIPVFGITGYLWGILASQILQSILYLLCLRRFIS